MGRSLQDESPNETASPSSPNRRRNTKKDIKLYEVQGMSLSTNQEFIAAQRANLDHVSRLDRRIDEIFDKM